MKFLLILGLLAPAILNAQVVTKKTEQALLIAQDSRATANLAAYFFDKNPKLRARAAFASGSVQDTSHITQLFLLINDKSADVRAAVAFALGQMNYVLDSTQRKAISGSLSKRLGVEKDRRVLLRVVEALGKVGDEVSLSVLVATGQTSFAPEVKAEAALSVGRYAYRGIKSKVATEFAASLLVPSFEGEHWKAAYALMRVSDAALFVKEEARIIQASAHQDANVRMFIATVLGKLASAPKAVNAALSLAISDTDWRVRVNAIRSVGKADSTFHSRVLPTLFRIVGDTNEHVSLTALSTLGDMRLKRSKFVRETRRTLTELLDDTTSRSTTRQRKEAASAFAKIFDAEAYSFLSKQFAANMIDKSSFIAALAHTPTRSSVEELLQFAINPSVQIQREALDALLTCAKIAHEDSAVVDRAKPAFIQALNSKDFAIIATAANALTDSLFADPQIVQPLLTTLQRLRSPNDSEAMVAIIQALAELNAPASIAPLESELNDPDWTVAMESAKALEKITSKSYKHLVKRQTTPSHINYDWSLLDEIRRKPIVKVETSRGSFTFKFLPDEAPFTCINIATLINRGLYNGLPFHRVVQNFVIQGGDPRGDGWGGPGFAMRSEFGFEHYETGTVGMASSGKDTEGSQWFVTHCNTPHLDGRYTIFGKVVSGMEIVDAIQVGDMIKGIVFVR